MRRHLIALCLAAASLMLLALAPAASAAKSTKRPTITKVSPMRVAVGATLTIRGRNFSAKRNRNTIIFRAPSGRTAFAKPRRASRSKLVLRVPPAVARLLVVRAGKPSATRIRLRILAGKFGKFTSKRLSPVVVSAGGLGLPGGPGGGGAGSGCPGPDYDNDLLTDAVELDLGTDPCLSDTDQDTIHDGYEEQAAIDLNHYPRTAPLPYPGKRPYPNALDPSDSGTDYDGDSLQLREEFLLWLRFSADGVARSGRPTTLSNLLYSDGLQKSIDPPPAAPSDPLYNWALDIREDDLLDDDERDADADGLGNWDESHGRMLASWWPAQHDGENEPKESAYPEINFLDNADLLQAGLLDALADPDIDGDGVLDGADDADHDGLSNQFEVRRPGDWQDDIGMTTPPSTNDWAYVNPFNPCKPYNSERCHSHPPFGYYESDDAPPIGPPPPGGYPDSRPATPDG